MKAGQLEGQVKGRDMRTVSVSHSFRTLAVVVNLEGTWGNGIHQAHHMLKDPSVRQGTVSQSQRSRPLASLLQGAYPDLLPFQVRTSLPSGPHQLLMRPSGSRWRAVTCPRLHKLPSLLCFPGRRPHLESWEARSERESTLGKPHSR